MPPPPPPLPDELLEEILLRLPPEDPGCLFRASLVCKPWRSRLTGSAFARLYREFHGKPPLLGFFENDKTVFCWFTPLSPTSPFLPVHPDHRDLFVLDSRHGRVLLNSVGPDGEPLDLIVWDPVGRRKWGLPYPEFADWVTVPDNAAVLCAVDGCDHLDCHGGPFLVVYVGTDEDDVAHACVYSSESCAWSPVTSYQSGGIKPPSTMASSSENLETTRDEHHDLLLLHSSGEVGDVKEKWVEKGEEDCEWKEGGWHEEGSVEDWEWKGEKAAQELFEKGSKAIEEGHFVDAKKFLHRALESWVLYCGRLSPMCVSTYYKYGIALLRKAQAKIAPHHQHVVEGSAIRDNTGSSKASGSNVRKGDTGKDLDLAWKMLNIARAILEKSPCIPMEKVLTFCALAEVSMEREDIDYSLRACFKALAILEHLVEPDHCRIVLLNLYIFLSLKSASKIPDALPYALKVFSLYKSRIEKLIRAKEALLAVKGDNSSAAEIGSEISSLDNEIEALFNIFSVLEEKLEDLGYKKHLPQP
ncbi:hypothetical protein QYE76_044929 [Lolium multiflorum]|uniref:F-box domain-containing protein n=1 Tax=Lolium multiflorum TaxID=4521 RepID=A0AAD8TK90_LOLMU|nr:hypothetical protein QYE76_044929 [Lolium multiflorum]